MEITVVIFECFSFYSSGQHRSKDILNSSFQNEIAIYLEILKNGLFSYNIDFNVIQSARHGSTLLFLRVM